MFPFLHVLKQMRFSLDGQLLEPSTRDWCPHKACIPISSFYALEGVFAHHFEANASHFTFHNLSHAGLCGMLTMDLP
jgi:hypothetical protein